MMTEQTVPAEVVDVASLLDDYASPEVRAGWLALAEEVEGQQAALADLVRRLQAAYAAQAAADGKAFLRLGEEWTDALDDALREASGWERLVQAVYAAKLHLAAEDRDRTPDESEVMAQLKARGEQ